ncbi:unnamed protein product [Ceratitis capitata]|uniref:(Mediterranean fruit fly) hypothetical protein n=1 Tax=Ceratitis capitata TaxID=7213 RepID=A0A811UVU1_CERCA|nr:unnamed protein product [Ceratitis capitata]
MCLYEHKVLGTIKLDIYRSYSEKVVENQGAFFTTLSIPLEDVPAQTPEININVHMFKKIFGMAERIVSHADNRKRHLDRRWLERVRLSSYIIPGRTQEKHHGINLNCSNSGVIV